MTHSEVIIVGGSYAGLSAAMALGRSLRNVRIIDNGKPCNRFTPFSHNFLLGDGVPPAQLRATAQQQVAAYPTILFTTATVTRVEGTNGDFTVHTDGGRFTAGKILFATGVYDELSHPEGLAACWGKSVLHCPYCHGYEVRGRLTGILASGPGAFEMSRLLSQWTRQLVLLTDGGPMPDAEQERLIRKHGISIITNKVVRLHHENGQLQRVEFANGQVLPLEVMYTHAPKRQHCPAPVQLGCAVDDMGLLVVNDFQETNIKGVYAAGDNCNPMRSVSLAVSAGSKAGALINKALVEESFI
ncbi:NAD(P)/FAD-dependent oxidoreductase [Nostoc ellipsosporum NOK]|nr:NAD(P)/FAD-dependent oxidoreductase [Nostoc ellipsosporum NOK]